jgi:hypothetical protein
MKGRRKTRVGKTVRRLPKIGRPESFKVQVVESDLRAYPFPDRPQEQFFPQEAVWYMNLYFLQNFLHDALASVRMSVPFTISFLISQPPIDPWRVMFIDTTHQVCYKKPSSRKHISGRGKTAAATDGRPIEEEGGNWPGKKGSIRGQGR